MKKVAIIMGSTSDLPKMEGAIEILKDYDEIVLKLKRQGFKFIRKIWG